MGRKLQYTMCACRVQSYSRSLIQHGVRGVDGLPINGCDTSALGHTLFSSCPQTGVQAYLCCVLIVDGCVIISFIPPYFELIYSAERSLLYHGA